MSEEEEAIKELMSMSQDELDLVPYDTVKLICQAKGCKRHTKIRDYGLSPVYYVRRYSLKWWNIEKIFFLCPTHYKFYYRLLKSFDAKHVIDKIIDLDKYPIEKL
jgi:hypothetical protein